MTSNSAVGSYSNPVQGLGVVRPHAATAAGPFALQYDAAGNMTRKLGPSADLTLTWNAENKLGRILVGAAEFQYRYAASDARALKTAVIATGNQLTRYLGPDAEHALGLVPRDRAVGHLLLARLRQDGQVRLRQACPGRDPGSSASLTCLPSAGRTRGC